MSVAKVIEIISSSKKSFEDAVAQGVAKPPIRCMTLRARG